MSPPPPSDSTKPPKGDSLAPEADDLDLFRQEMADVRPIKSTRERRRKPPPPPSNRHSRADERQVMDELKRGEIDWAEVESGEELNFVRDGLSPKLLKKLRRGQYSVGAELDLHQMNIEAARVSVLDFIDYCQQRGITCVKIIHGKGLRSKSRGPVLKGLTNSLLRRRKAVLAFTSARPNDGGTGAVYVLLSAG
ncbi:MAG: Smr/MutS family protein [Pseudomonadota bacterium]